MARTKGPGGQSRCQYCQNFFDARGFHRHEETCSERPLPTRRPQKRRKKKSSDQQDVQVCTLHFILERIFPDSFIQGILAAAAVMHDDDGPTTVLSTDQCTYLMFWP